jgi:hypothetical protein
VLLAALALRLAWGLSRPVDGASIASLPDQRGYLALGRNLLSGADLQYVDDRFGQRLYAARTPGYPLFIAMCGGSIRAVRVVQALIDTSTVLAVYLLARRMLPQARAPLIAAALIAFNPFLVYFSALLLTETLYTAVLAWGMVLLLHPRGWVVGIALLALGVLVRPAGILLPALMAATGPIPRAGRIKPVLTAVVLTFLVLAPWALRNDLVLGRWLWSTSNDGITAYDGLHPGATGASNQSFVKDMPHVNGMSELERSDYFAAEARRFARENPGRVAWLTLVKIARTWSPAPLSEEFGRPAYRAIALMYALPFYMLVIVGIVRAGLPRRAILFLVLPALYITVIHAMSVGSLRYRIPAEPPLAVLAAAGAMSVRAARSSDRP